MWKETLSTTTMAMEQIYSGEGGERSEQLPLKLFVGQVIPCTARYRTVCAPCLFDVFGRIRNAGCPLCCSARHGISRHLLFACGVSRFLALDSRFDCGFFLGCCRFSYFEFFSRPRLVPAVPGECDAATFHWHLHQGCRSNGIRSVDTDEVISWRL